MPPAQFVLASSSPRRRALLEQLGLEFEIAHPDIDETRLEHETPAAMVERVALEKAAAVGGPLPVLAADTAVILDGVVLGKPGDAAHARHMLALLAGRRHTVATGVAVRYAGGDSTSVVTAEVAFADMSADEIAWYVATGEPLDKAGAYGLGTIGSAFVERIEGSHSAVMGLPLAETIALLRTAGVRLAGSS